jgi:hypothetical protein
MWAIIPRPIPLAVIGAGIPDALKSERRWVIWRYEWDAKHQRWTKVPYRTAHPSKKASSTNSKTWGSFQDALKGYQSRAADGVGFVLGDGFFALDVDHCVTNGVLDEQVRTIVATLGTYAEISPAGDGLHVLGRGRKRGRGQNFRTKAGQNFRNPQDERRTDSSRATSLLAARGVQPVPEIVPAARQKHVIQLTCRKMESRRKSLNCNDRHTWRGGRVV